MPQLRPEEQWVAQMMAHELGVRVGQHDDGSRRGMHDLTLEMPNTTGAAEVVVCADSESLATWHRMYRDGPQQMPNLRLQWLVHVEPDCRINALERELPALLALAEGVGTVDVVTDRLAALSARAQVIPGGAPGRVDYWLDPAVDRTAGLVPSDGNGVSAWVSAWLREPGQADVLRKLATSGADERHAFVLVPALSRAPFAVLYVLLDAAPVVPTAAPDLPAEVTHVWLASTMSSANGLRWSPSNGWRHFDKLQPG